MGTEAKITTVEQARAFLDRCHRESLADHAFGDAEVDWFLDGKHVASGYFGNSGDDVGSCDLIDDPPEVVAMRWQFTGAEARSLRYCGVTFKTFRNDAG